MKAARKMKCSAKAVALSVVMAMAAWGLPAAEGVSWIDGADLPLEGRGFADVARRYDRLPKRAEGKVPSEVWRLSHQSAGMAFRFRTDSRTLRFRWTVGDASLGNYHFCPTGKSGIDVYRRTTNGWRHVKAGCAFAVSNEVSCAWTPGDEALVYLPNYNVLTGFALGVDGGTEVRPPLPRASGVAKPVVIYGSSITQGACASRAGMAFVSIAGRIADVEMVNLGFSGSGKMEDEVRDFVNEIDASCFVIDSAWNIDSATVAQRWEPFARAVRAAHPAVPIVFMEPCHESHQRDKGKASEVIRACYEKLRHEDPKQWDRLYLLRADAQLPGDDETTVEGVHPNDWGMMHVGQALGELLKRVVGPTSPSPAAKVRVACIGDSITWGYAMTNRVAECYPAQLQRLLGPDYDVRNFGDPGAGVYSRPKADPRGWTEHTWRTGKNGAAAYAFEPDIVVCNLGINDSGSYLYEFTYDEKGHPKTEPGLFRREYEELLRAFGKGGKLPRIIMWTRLGPLGKSHPAKGSPNPFVMERDLRAVAEAVGAEQLDMYTPLLPYAETPDFADDGVHPEGGAQRVIAEITAKRILGPQKTQSN